MKLNILYALLSGATAVTAGPPPPSSSDVCAKAGVEIDPTSMATFEGSFHIKAQAKTFTGPQPGITRGRVGVAVLNIPIIKKVMPTTV
jgi:hypothetical protein